MTRRRRWAGTLNFRAYDQVESLANYPSRTALEVYRRERLAAYASCVEFLRQRAPASGLRVVEIGSGSSALLYALARRGILAEGIGIELSATRHTFAEKWRREGGFRRVRNVRTNFADVPLPSRAFDGVIVIDNTFSYLYPENRRYPSILLRMAAQALVPGGFILLELNNYARFAPSIPREGRTFWVELPETNPFRFALYRQEHDSAANMLRTESVYIPRRGVEKRKTELSYIYDVRRLTRMLRDHGFEISGVYSDFRASPFRPTASERLVVVAERRQSTAVAARLP